LRVSTDLQQGITLAPMNTGNTRPYAHERSLSTFSRMTDYPFGKRLGRGPYYTVVELAVEIGVPDVMQYVVRAAEMKCSSCAATGGQSIRATKELYP
jgi:hypothetical protein